MTFSPPLLTGLFGSKLYRSGLDPVREDDRSLFGVLRPLLVDGLLPVVGTGGGNGGNAQSKFAESSGLGGLWSRMRGIGLVMLLSGGGGFDPILLPERTLDTGEIGVSD